MTVFKACIKICSRNLGDILIMLGVFIGMSLLFSSYSSDNSKEGYVNANIKVAYIDNDNSILSKGIKTYLKDKVQLKDIVETDEGIQDALFYRIVEYIIIIPEGFLDSFIKGEIKEIEKREVAESFSGIYVSNIINNFMNSLDLYKTGIKNDDMESLLKKAMENVEIKSEVEFLQEVKKEKADLKQQFIFAAYTIMGSIIASVGTLAAIFNNKEIKRRNKISAIRPTSLNLILVLANLCLTIFIWSIIMMFVYLMHGKEMLNYKGGFYVLNSLVFSIDALSIGFFASTFVSSANGRSAIANTVALGSSFLTGVFVPISILGENVRNVARFLPSYWYVDACEKIHSLTSFSLNNSKEIFINMGIQILFALALVSVGLVIARQKSLASNS